MTNLSSVDIRDIILDRLARGIYPAGSKLPAARKLADELGSNRNTVVKAYQFLADMGLVTMRQGRGTYAVAGISKGRGPQLSTLIQDEVAGLIRKARQFGLGEDEIRRIVDEQLALIYRGQSTRAAFIECNTGAIDAAISEIAALTGVRLSPLMLADVESDLVTVPQTYDVVFTTLFHLRDVTGLLSGFTPSLKIVGVHTQPDERALEEIAHIPPDSQIGIVVSDYTGGHGIANQIEAFTHTTPRLLVQPTDDEIRKLAEEVDFIVCTRSQISKVQALGLDVPIIALPFRISPQSASRILDVFNGSSDTAVPGIGVQ